MVVETYKERDGANALRSTRCFPAMLIMLIIMLITWGLTAPPPPRTAPLLSGRDALSGSSRPRWRLTCFHGFMQQRRHSRPGPIREDADALDQSESTQAARKHRAHGQEPRAMWGGAAAAGSGSTGPFHPVTWNQQHVDLHELHLLNYTYYTY